MSINPITIQILNQVLARVQVLEEQVRHLWAIERIAAHGSSSGGDNRGGGGSSRIDEGTSGHSSSSSSGNGGGSGGSGGSGGGSGNDGDRSSSQINVPPTLCFNEWVSEAVQTTYEDAEHIMNSGAHDIKITIISIVARILQNPELPMRVFADRPSTVFVYRGGSPSLGVEVIEVVPGKRRNKRRTPLHDGWSPLHADDVAKIGNKIQNELMKHVVVWKQRRSVELNNNNALFDQFLRIIPKLFPISQNILGDMRKYIMCTLGAVPRNSTRTV